MFRNAVLSCWGLPWCSLRSTPPFIASRSSPTPGALLSSLGDPCSLNFLQSTPLLLLPLTEMPREFVLTSGLCNLVPSTSLGTGMSGDLYWFVHLVFVFPINLPGSGVRAKNDIHVCYPKVEDHIKTPVCSCEAAITHFSCFITLLSGTCYKGVWDSSG